VRFGFEQTSPAGSGSPNHGTVRRSACNISTGPEAIRYRASKVLPATKVQQARCRRPKVVLKEVVTHGKVLRVVPQRGYGIAVVVAQRAVGPRFLSLQLKGCPFGSVR